MAKKLNLTDLKVESFITEGNKVTGGTGSIPTGGVCTRYVVCGSAWDCSAAAHCVTDPSYC